MVSGLLVDHRKEKGFSMVKKYLSDIHLEDYAAGYENTKATHKDMVFEGGRAFLSLKG